MAQEEAASSQNNGPLPVLLAMLLCDQVIVDANNGKKSLIGLFDEIRSDVFPFKQRLTIFARFTDAEGSYLFKTELALSDNDEITGHGGGTVKIENRLSTHDLMFDFSPAFEREGEYEFRLYANDAYLGRVALKVLKSE